MSEVRFAPGLTADWLNGWLAAIGVTVLLPEARLAWTSDPIPRAAFMVADGTVLVDALAAAIDASDPLLEVLRLIGPSPTLDQFVIAALPARKSNDRLLGASLTDLIPTKDFPKKATGLVNPGVERGWSLAQRWERARTLLSGDPGSRERLSWALDGLLRPDRLVPGNGLGFDYRRLPAYPEGDGVWTDPAIEVLALFGSALLPVRGNGSRRSWRGCGRPGVDDFRWPTWAQPLDQWAIDALLDRPYTQEGTSGASGAFKLVKLRSGDGKKHSAYAAKRAW